MDATTVTSPENWVPSLQTSVRCLEWRESRLRWYVRIKTTIGKYSFEVPSDWSLEDAAFYVDLCRLHLQTECLLAGTKRNLFHFDLDATEYELESSGPPDHLSAWIGHKLQQQMDSLAGESYHLARYKDRKVASPL